MIKVLHLKNFCNEMGLKRIYTIERTVNARTATELQRIF